MLNLKTSQGKLLGPQSVQNGLCDAQAECRQALVIPPFVTTVANITPELLHYPGERGEWTVLPGHLTKPLGCNFSPTKRGQKELHA